MSITGQNLKILQKLRGHTSDVTTCDFAPNFTLITGSSDKTVRIWDWVPGSGYVQRHLSPLRVHKYQVTCVRVSPQGSLFASASVDGTAVLWNLHFTKKLFTITQVNGDAIRVCSFAPDSSILVTAGDNGAVCVWDLVHKSLIRTLLQHEGTTQSLAFTPDSQYLVSACSLEVVRVWYVQDLVDTTNDSNCVSLAKVDNAHDMGVFCVDISKHVEIDENNPLIKYYRLATCGNSNEIKIWTITSTSVTKTKLTSTNDVVLDPCDTYDGHSSSVTCIRYTNNGSYLISSCLDKLVKIWDTATGSCVATLEGHTRYVNCTAISKDSTLLVSGSNDKLLIVWDISGNITTDSELFHQELTYNVPGTPDEMHLVNMSDCDENEVKLLEKIDDISDGAINSCCFYGNEMLATGSGDKLVRLFNVIEENNNIEETTWSPLEGHTYAINHVEFSKDGTMLASCSLDGCTSLWNPKTGEKLVSMPKNSLSVKVCRFSPNCRLLITAGDDDKATVWNSETMEEIKILEGHLDAVTSAAFSPDGKIIITTSFNSDFRVWSVGTYKCLHIQEDAHTFGIQSCDFSDNLEPIPNSHVDVQTYLLASCGNDGLAKLWRVSMIKENDENVFDDLEVKVWRTFTGHGGNVICVRFSPSVGEVVCSTATDRQARIWSVYSSECLYVLDHDSIVTTCGFSADCSLLAVGCLDKTLWLWKLPQQLVFQSAVANKFKCRTKAIIDWNSHDVAKWLKDINMEGIIENVHNSSLDGVKLITLPEENICSGLDLDEEQTEKMLKEIRWLKKAELQIEKPENVEIPHEFLCPITHEIMREPVTCSDGYTYEKNAIAEWFISGKYTSPMTNERLNNTDYIYNLDLRNAIHSFLENLDQADEE
ncbi:WD repeat, SAM and U-box domain-containing protein 1 isoform X2 [Aethina tumida]|uniref:WD repeat, SAM and U-box domain-containing protein 1 isoform X2 n=1 Tax=Aethina tumida TaxID=116153 RepID=UPI00214969F2|nr:WD repeat, SAM and U-box domain-containing protein 1 isoform X2 [Aethina tumida]